MASKFPVLVLAFSALVLASCKGVEEPPTPPPPPSSLLEAHHCLTFWGTSADNLMVKLNDMKAAHHNMWALHLADFATYQSLKDLEREVGLALKLGVDPKAWEKGGTIPDDGIKALADKVRLGEGGMGGLDLDRTSGAHPRCDQEDWLRNVYDTSVPPLEVPNDPLVRAKAEALLSCLKEALDM